MVYNYEGNSQKKKMLIPDHAYRGERNQISDRRKETKIAIFNCHIYWK